MKLKRRHITRLAASLALAALCNCSRDPGAEEMVMQPVKLTLSVGTGSKEASTKMDVSLLTEMDSHTPVFRGLSDVVLVPFSQTGEIQPSDVARTQPLSIPGFSRIDPLTGAYLYASGIEAWIPTGTASMLLYAKAPETQDRGSQNSAAHRFGSLVRTGFDGGSLPSASSLGFSPDLMYDEYEIPEQASVIANTLNTIMIGTPSTILVSYDNDKSTSVRVNWNESVGDDTFREAFVQITNEGALIPGSGNMVEALLSSLYNLLRNYESRNLNEYKVEDGGILYVAYKNDGQPLLYRDLYNRLRDAILLRFQNENLRVDATNYTVRFADEEVREYPENLGLPSGCAVLRWTSNGFVVPRDQGVEGMASMNRFCYPPSLYYYSNTTIRTSQEEDVRSYYSGSHTQWSQILSDYTLGAEVTGNTNSVALVEPAHYAVAMLNTTVKAASALLQDNDGRPETTVDASGQNLPVTGIILGGQYHQLYDFTPAYSDDGEYYLYDNQTSGVYLTTTESDPISTLTLQTPEDRDVFFSLELRNDTGSTFTGAEGRVLPGRKFYLIGKLTLPDNPGAFHSIFVKDHITSIKCNILSLAGAHNAIPDLGHPQLVVGVQTQIYWDLATPTTLLME